MDQFRDELLYSNVKGKNPFKDLRVRKALYQAIDIETMKTKLMSGQSFPTGGMTPSPLGRLQRPEDREAPALRPGRGQEADGRGRLPERLRGHARLPEQPLHQRRGDLHRAGRRCGRKIGVKVKVLARCRASTYFPKLEKFDTSMYMLGWGGAVTDAETTLTPVMRNNPARRASASSTSARAATLADLVRGLRAAAATPAESPRPLSGVRVQ